MSVPIENLAHLAEARALLIEQFKARPVLDGFLRSYVNRVQALEVAVFDVIDGRILNTSTASQLDSLGSLVGEKRLGRTDEEFRQAIRLRIRVNRSNGKTVDVLSVAMLAAAPERVTYDEHGFLQFTVEIYNRPGERYVAELLGKTRAATSAGILIASDLAVSSLLTFDDAVSPIVGTETFSDAVSGGRVAAAGYALPTDFTGVSLGSVVAPTPSVLSISPNVADTSGGGGLLTISGSGLTSTTQVSLGGTNVAGFTVVNDTTITCTPAARTAGANLSVAVTGPGGTGTLTNAFEYWTPAQIPSVDAYLDSNKGVTITTNVSTWTSQSAGSVAFTQPTVGNRPSQVASVFGSLPAIRFTPQQWVACTRRTLASGFSIFAVMRTTNTIAAPVQALNAATTILGDANGANGYIQFGMSNGAVDLTEFSGGTVKTTRGSGFNDNQPRLIGATHNSTTNVQTLYQGATQQGATATVAYPSLAGYEAVGTGYTNIDGWDGDIGAVIIVNAVIDGAELTRLNSWARQRFGTP